MPNKTLSQTLPGLKDLLTRQNTTIESVNATVTTQAATIKAHEATIAGLQSQLKTFTDQQAADAEALDYLNQIIAANPTAPQPLPGAKELQAVNATPAKPGTVTFTQKP